MEWWSDGAELDEVTSLPSKNSWFVGFDSQYLKTLASCPLPVWALESSGPGELVKMTYCESGVESGRLKQENPLSPQVQVQPGQQSDIKDTFWNPAQTCRV